MHIYRRKKSLASCKDSESSKKYKCRISHTRENNTYKQVPKQWDIILRQINKCQRNAQYPKSTRIPWNNIKVSLISMCGSWKITLWHLEYVDGAGPANMSGDLPSKKSHLNLRLFGLGFLAMGCTISLWPWLQTNPSKMSMLVARVWHAQQAKEGVYTVLTHRNWGECAP